MDWAASCEILAAVQARRSLNCGVSDRRLGFSYRTARVAGWAWPRIFGHLIDSTILGIGFGLDALYYTGGRGTIDGRKGESLEDARIGLTLALPINRYNSLKLYGSTDGYTKTGTESAVLGIAWQARWGGGL